MEFLFGVIVTLVFEFIGYKVYQSRQKRKLRAAYIPPAGSGLDRPIKDSEDSFRP